MKIVGTIARIGQIALVILWMAACSGGGQSGGDLAMNGPTAEKGGNPVSSDQTKETRNDDPAGNSEEYQDSDSREHDGDGVSDEGDDKNDKKDKEDEKDKNDETDKKDEEDGHAQDGEDANDSGFGGSGSGHDAENSGGDGGHGDDMETIMTPMIVPGLAALETPRKKRMTATELLTRTIDPMTMRALVTTRNSRLSRQRTNNNESARSISPKRPSSWPSGTISEKTTAGKCMAE